MRFSIPLYIVLVFVILIMTGCMPGHQRYQDREAGFLWGVWHGWIAPISLLRGLVYPEAGIYETHNTGWWYDFGFYIAIIGGFGGFSFFRFRKR